MEIVSMEIGCYWL